jgi:hypothetical protein
MAQHTQVITLVGVHVEVWNLPVVDAGIRLATVTVLTVTAHGYCQHQGPIWEDRLID